MPPTDGHPIFTRSAEPSSTTPAGGKSGLLPPNARPEEVLERIRALVTDEYPKARRLAAEAAARFPDHDEIRSANLVLNRPQAPVATMPPEPSTDEEFEWLKDPPDSVHGKWVALVGKELVAVADTLMDLVKTLRSENFRERALVHRVE